MVVCEDGRMKRSEYRKFRVAPSDGEHQASSDRRARHAIPRRLRRDASRSSQRRYRRVLEAAGRFPI